MKASRFTDAQKAFIMRQGEDGTPLEDICRKAGSSQATHFNWNKTYSGMMPSEMKQLHSTNPLEDLNGEIKRRTDVVAIFPNEAAIVRLVDALVHQKGLRLGFDYYGRHVDLHR